MGEEEAAVQNEESVDPKLQQYIDTITSQYKTLGIVVVSGEGKAVRSTFDFGKTKVLAELAHQTYEVVDTRLVREIDGTDAVRFVRIAAHMRELLIAPFDDKLVAVLVNSVE